MLRCTIGKNNKPYYYEGSKRISQKNAEKLAKERGIVLDCSQTGKQFAASFVALPEKTTVVKKASTKKATAPKKAVKATASPKKVTTKKATASPKTGSKKATAEKAVKASVSPRKATTKKAVAPKKTTPKKSSPKKATPPKKVARKPLNIEVVPVFSKSPKKVQRQKLVIATIPAETIEPVKRKTPKVSRKKPQLRSFLLPEETIESVKKQTPKISRKKPQLRSFLLPGETIKPVKREKNLTMQVLEPIKEIKYETPPRQKEKKIARKRNVTIEEAKLARLLALDPNYVWENEVKESITKEGKRTGRYYFVDPRVGKVYFITQKTKDGFIVKNPRLDQLYFPQMNLVMKQKGKKTVVGIVDSHGKFRLDMNKLGKKARPAMLSKMGLIGKEEDKYVPMN